MRRAATSTKPKNAEAVAQVKAYIAAFPTDVRREIRKLRAAIHAAAPGAEDAFSYGIPAAALDGRPFIWYAAWKHHLSLYPIGTAIRRAHSAALRGHAISKATIRFPLAHPPSAALIGQLVKARIKEVRAKTRR
jgi:uncharacterized protein YdhG (YjbR/CyaY superfamily)